MTKRGTALNLRAIPGLCCAVTIGVCGNVQAATVAPPAASRAQQIKDLAVAAKDLCANPSSYGFSRGADGRLSGTLSASNLAKKLADIRGSASLGARAEDWSGLPQKDLHADLADARRCSQNVLRLMLDHLDRPGPSRGAMTGGPAPQSKQGDSYVNYGFNTGIIGPVTVGKVPFELTPERIADLLTKVPTGVPVVVVEIGSRKYDSMEQVLEGKLKDAGHSVSATVIRSGGPSVSEPLTVRLEGSTALVILSPDA